MLGVPIVGREKSRYAGTRLFGISSFDTADTTPFQHVLPLLTSDFLQCDESTPACSQCINTKRQCPGYVARFDLVLRDQTKAVRRKAQRRKQADEDARTARSSPKRGSPNSDTPSNSVSAGRSELPGVVKKNRTSDDDVPRMFNDFPEQQAICAFFLDFVLLPRNPDSVRGHLEHLQPLYQKAAPESPLALATSSVALIMSGGSAVRTADQQQMGRATFGRALQKTSTAIRDPVESLKDETLMAVLLLGLFEVRSMYPTCKPH